MGVNGDTRSLNYDAHEDELRKSSAQLDAFSWTALLCAFEKLDCCQGT